MTPPNAELEPVSLPQEEVSATAGVRFLGRQMQKDTRDRIIVGLVALSPVWVGGTIELIHLAVKGRAF